MHKCISDVGSEWPIYCQHFLCKVITSFLLIALFYIVCNLKKKRSEVYKSKQMGERPSETEDNKSLLKRVNACTGDIDNPGVTMVSDVLALR